MHNKPIKKYLTSLCLNCLLKADGVMSYWEESTEPQRFGPKVVPFLLIVKEVARNIYISLVAEWVA